MKTMATDRLKEMLDSAWLKLNADGTLHSCDWVKAEVLAEQWVAGIHNPTTNTAAVAIAIRDHSRSEKQMKHWLWGLAERMDWEGRFPKRFWRWLLKRMDRAHGHHLSYD